MLFVIIKIYDYDDYDYDYNSEKQAVAYNKTNHKEFDCLVGREIQEDHYTCTRVKTRSKKWNCTTIFEEQ